MIFFFSFVYVHKTREKSDFTLFILLHSKLPFKHIMIFEMAITFVVLNQQKVHFLTL